MSKELSDGEFLRETINLYGVGDRAFRVLEIASLLDARDRELALQQTLEGQILQKLEHQERIDRICRRYHEQNKYTLSAGLNHGEQAND